MSILSVKREMRNQTDQYYIDQILEGNTRAFSFLMEKYQHMVFTISVRMMNDREEAEDVAQEVFIKAYQKLDKFKGKSKFSTWLYRITYNYCLDRLKLKKKLIKSGIIDEVNEGNLIMEDETITNIEEQEKKTVIQHAIQALDRDDQVIVTLYYYEELSLKEIAHTMGMTLSNVKVKLFRSRNKLSELLKNTTLTY
ncbi:RNA polymerase sigma factor [Leptobacterium sp. I13]|uniref:RNA polymerase sigma factor n=1 Tax=Leptobacterium meishanense TaxID=3128904 RepID=UPI0030EEC902